MNFQCNCDMRTRAVGDGCIKCNTEYFFDAIPQPEEMEELLTEYGLTQCQAEGVSDCVFSPLVSVMQAMNEKIDELSRKVI